MTAPDDLARTLAACLAKHRYEARNVNPDGRVGWLTCSCGWGKDATPPVRADLAVSIWESIHLAEHLASVVSRRDADLRTRIEAALNERVTPTLGFAEWAADPLPSCPNYAHVNPEWLLELIAEAVAVRKALDADTREVAP